MRRRMRLAGVLTAIALAAAMTLAGDGNRPGPTSPPPSGWAEIYSPYLHAQGITLCFDDTNGVHVQRHAGAAVSLPRVRLQRGTPAVGVHPARGQQRQTSSTTVTAALSTRSTNLAAGLCLTAQNLLAGMPLTLGTCNRATTTGQIWWELPGVGSPGRPGFRDLPVARQLLLRQLRRREQRLRQQPHPPGDGALRPPATPPGSSDSASARPALPGGGRRPFLCWPFLCWPFLGWPFLGSPAQARPRPGSSPG